MEGRSLLPLLTGESISWRASFLTEYFEEEPFPRIPMWESVRTERFKLIRYPELGRRFDELYDLAVDPYELRNQIANAEFSAQVERLEALLDRLLESVADNDAPLKRQFFSSTTMTSIVAGPSFRSPCRTSGGSLSNQYALPAFHS